MSRVRIIPPKQRLFVAEYLVDKNGKAAAIRAGYSPGNAKVRASKLLAKPEIQALLEKSLRRQEERLEVKADDILRELLRIARVDLAEAYDKNGNLLPIHEMPEDIRRAIAGVKVFEEFDGHGEDRVKIGDVREVKFWDKPRALELLGKHLKLFTEKHEHSGVDGAPLSIVFKAGRSTAK